MGSEVTPEVMQSIARAWYPEVIAQILWVQSAYLLLIGPIRRRYRLGPPARPRQILWFSLAMFAAFLAEGTPIHLVSEVYLFSVHMVQHLLLTLVMPPLMILGLPEWAFRPLLHPRIAPVVRFLVSPLPALVLFNTVYTIWHLPLFYEAALYSHPIHVFEHITMIFTALILWWPILSPMKELPRLPEPIQLIYITLTSVAHIGVFAVVTFSNKVLYEFYAGKPRIFGITPEMDQTMAGIVMKVGGSLIFVFVLGVVFYRWAKREGAKEPAHPHAGRPPAPLSPGPSQS